MATLLFSKVEVAYAVTSDANDDKVGDAVAIFFSVVGRVAVASVHLDNDSAGYADEKHF